MAGGEGLGEGVRDGVEESDADWGVGVVEGEGVDDEEGLGVGDWEGLEEGVEEGRDMQDKSVASPSRA